MFNERQKYSNQIIYIFLLFLNFSRIKKFVAVAFGQTKVGLTFIFLSLSLKIVEAMNVEYFRENFELMRHSGVTLTELEAALVENSLIIVQFENKLRDIFFFGRIDTSSTARYYIAFGYRSDILKDRQFFYSLNGHEWILMPELKPKLIPIALQARTLLSGEPMNVENVCMVRFYITN
jgi:hypothetical protein